MPTVCVYTPMRNEAMHVKRWVETSEGADHRLILDTGSTDATPKIALDLGVDTHVAPWDQHAFRFDDARNTALALIPTDIDIVIQLDADELFLPGWRDELERVNPRHSRWSYWLDSGGHGSWGRVRRTNCHRRHGYQWKHPIHEIVVGGPVHAHLDNLVIVHEPDPRKSRRDYLPLLERAVEEDPECGRMLFYLGREQMYRSQWNRARPTLERYLTTKGNSGAERGEAYIYLGKMDHRPARWYWKAIGEEPRRREPFVYLAKLALNRHQWREAEALIELALQRTDRSIYTTHNECWDEPFSRWLSEARALITKARVQ